MRIEVALLDPRSGPLYASELDLRHRVLRAPLGFGRHEVTFDGEEDALHTVAIEGGVVVGCVLFDFVSGRLRAMAVDVPLQRMGLGGRLVRRLEEEVGMRGIRTVVLHARAEVVGFYERLGYSVRGEPFTEVGILHRAMAKAW
jgi:ribosomal protein S18 acetylase RimI-like enzyme